jgi:hypothetical protein
VPAASTRKRASGLGREQHRHPPGRDRARLQARGGALGGAAPDRGRCLEVVGRQRGRVPAIALHRIALPRDQRAADGVLGAAIATDEAMRIRVHAERRAAADRSAVGIGDSCIAVAPGGLAGQRQVDGAIGVQRPRMPGVEIGKPARRRLRHERCLGQAGGRVVLGMARDRTGLFDGGVQALLAQVGGAGAALALAEVLGHGDAAVTGGLHRLDRAHAHVHAEPALLAAADLGLAGAAFAAKFEQPLRGGGEMVQPRPAVVGGDGGDCVQWLILHACPFARARPSVAGDRE